MKKPPPRLEFNNCYTCSAMDWASPGICDECKKPYGNKPEDKLKINSGGCKQFKDKRNEKTST